VGCDLVGGGLDGLEAAGRGRRGELPSEGRDGPRAEGGYPLAGGRRGELNDPAAKPPRGAAPSEGGEIVTGCWPSLGQAPSLGLILLIGLYIACELIANVTAGKPVVVGPLRVPAGVFIYALTFTLLDLINERLGRIGARRVIATAFAANLLLAGYAQLTVALPAPEFFDGQAAYARVLGATPRIVAASLIAYLTAALTDAEVFAWWRARVGGYRWLRVLVSNALSTAVDSVVFVTLAFGGLLPVAPLIVGQYAVKMAVTVVSVPLVYLIRAVPGPPPIPRRAGLAEPA
jgi:queuosine precursor transporter